MVISSISLRSTSALNVTAVPTTVVSAATSPPSVPLPTGEARRMLAKAMISIGRAENPEAEFDTHINSIVAALKALGKEDSLAKFIHSCGLPER